MTTLMSRLTCGARDQDLWGIAALFWLASLVRVVLGLLHGEVFGVEASLALCCVFLIPWALLPREQRVAQVAARRGRGDASGDFGARSQRAR